MIHPTINVVGAGLAGSLVARYLRLSAFWEIRVIDNADPFSGSQASSNLFIDHWLKKFNANQARRGVEVLERLFRHQIDQPFARGIANAMKVRHIAQRHVLVEPDVQATVAEVCDEGVVLENGEMLEGPTIVCAGHLVPRLLPDVKVKVKVGHCYLFKGRLPPGASTLAVVSPYRHEKLYQFDDEHVYYADSVAVDLKTYQKRQEELRERTLQRAQRLVGDLPVAEFRVGYRPIIPGHDFGLLSRHGQRIWSVNGGGKNGLVAYANLATGAEQALLEELT